MHPEFYYADYDQDSGLFCVFHPDSGYAYASFASIEQAKEKAVEMNANREHRIKNFGWIPGGK